MSRNHEGGPPGKQGQQPGDEIIFLDSLAASVRRRQALTLELQAERDASDVHSPWRNAPLPRFDDHEGLDPWGSADAPRTPWDEPAPPTHAQQSGAGASVAPVAMTSIEAQEPRLARRHIVQGVGYAVLLSAVCLAAVGFYRAASPRQRSTAAAPNAIATPTAPAPSASASTEIGLASPDMARVDLALGLAWGRAQACLHSRDAGAMVSMKLVLAPGGQVIAAWVTGSRYQDTPVGDCIARQFLSTTIAPFQGESLVIHRSYTVQ